MAASRVVPLTGSGNFSSILATIENEPHYRRLGCFPERGPFCRPFDLWNPCPYHKLNPGDDPANRLTIAAMRDLCSLIWCVVIGFLRPRMALQAEILILRHVRFAPFYVRSSRRGRAASAARRARASWRLTAPPKSFGRGLSIYRNAMPFLGVRSIQKPDLRQYERHSTFGPQEDKARLSSDRCGTLLQRSVASP
jgi:hypothetical protein